MIYIYDLTTSFSDTFVMFRDMKKTLSCGLSLQEIRRRGLKVAVAGIPKTIDNDIMVHKPFFLLILGIRILFTNTT